MRKVMIILLIIILIGVGVYLCFDRNNDTPEYQKNKYEETPQFQSKEDRQEFVNEFASEGEILDSDNDEYPYEAGGFDTASIINIADLLDYVGVDGMIFVKEELTLSLEMLPKIKEDTMNLDNGVIGQYISEHQDKFIEQYGITEIDNFKTFTKSLSFIKENEKITEGVIDKSPIEKVGNSVTFDLTVKTDKGNSNTYKIRVEIVPTNENMEYSIFWEVGSDTNG